MRNLLFSCLFLLLCAFGCNQNGSNSNDHNNSDPMEEHEHTNRLAQETSPYLLQHAHNPVDWYPWGEEALQKAQAEDKLLLISVGYSACHWCHVMERESFEDTAVARIMNENFVCIKVDREERPDVDQIYMNAVQLMTQSGGWPLNCFALPDGKPFFGGTYFPKEQWVNLMTKVQNEWTNNREAVNDYAARLTEGVQTSELIEVNPEPPDFTSDMIDKVVLAWENQFDPVEGGPNRAPKFPMPNNYQFLLRQAFLNDEKALKSYVLLTLDKIAMGGIYDQLGGGFARYSVDAVWKVPHFEKMLYDNAQLVSLYSEAYQATGKPLYKNVVYESLEFVERELTDKTGAFYSALDADSDGEEGKFYVWKKEELQAELGEEFDWFSDYYNVNNKGLWEHGNYILLKDRDHAKMAKKLKLSEEELYTKIDAAKAKLMQVRDQRIRPGLDDKSLTSWNALMLKGYVDAYQVFGEKTFLDRALKNADFILNTQRRDDGGLWHSYKAGKSTINGYLEDYCFTIEAFIALYEATFDQKWLTEAQKLADYSVTHFLDEERGLFYFTSDLDKALIARKSEINDNVIPASNSSMAKGLFLLGHLLDRQDFLDRSEAMLNNVNQQLARYPSGYSNWLMLMQYHTNPFYEVAIVGKDAHDKRQEFSSEYIPNKMLIGSLGESQLPLLEYKHVEGTTKIYVCLNKMCKLPVENVAEALTQID